jgi:DNA-binding HxlR family transcriptional regulator
MADATNKVYYCPIELALDVVASKWKPTLLRHLAGGGRRGGELRRRLPLVTRHTLAQLLADLEADGLVRRTLLSDDPERIEVALTETGRRLAPILERLAEFGEAYAAEREIELLDEDDAEAVEAEDAMARSGRWLPL